MMALIDEHRAAYGVEPICRVLPIAPSTYCLHVARRADPARRRARVQRDDALLPLIHRVWDDNRQVYGVRKVWEQLRRGGTDSCRGRVSEVPGQEPEERSTECAAALG
jgi:putative transposase